MRFTSILIVFFIPTIFGQEKQNDTEIIDTLDDMSVSRWKPSPKLSYAQNLTEFIEQIQGDSGYVQLPERDQLSFLEKVEGVWYTLWNELILPPTDASITYSTIGVTIDYLTIFYTLCGESCITISTGNWQEMLQNTVEQDGNYTCDGQMRQESFYLDRKYGVTISLFANTSETPCFAMIDRIETATEIEIPPTTTLDPNRTTTKRTASSSSTGSITPGSGPTATTPPSGGDGGGSSTVSLCQFLSILIVIMSILHTFK